MPPVNVDSGDVPGAVPASPQTHSLLGPLITVTTLFFIWGFLTSLNDILVPHFKETFELNYAKVMLIQLAFFSAYFFFSIPSAKVIDWIGYQKTMVLGLATMALGALLFIPAASVPSFPLFLTALMILGTGITALQVAANPYVTVLGPAKTSSSRLTWTQAFNSLGTLLGPPLGGLLILSVAPKTVDEKRGMSPQALHAYQLQEAASVKHPYLVICVALVILGVIIASAKLPPIPEAQRHQARGSSADSVWRHRHLVLGAIGIFVYVGAEVSIGSLMINYISQPAIGGLSQAAASRYLGYFYWGGAMVGRFIGSGVLRRITTGTLLGCAAAGSCILVLISTSATGHVAMWTILAVGLCNSIMFPSIFALGVAELGPLTGDGSGLLNTAIVGGAIIPLIAGALADRFGVQHALLLPAVCYVYILYYALKGSRPAIRGPLPDR
jgi:MFS transporter, FHS family, L-fucose permease